MKHVCKYFLSSRTMLKLVHTYNRKALVHSGSILNKKKCENFYIFSLLHSKLNWDFHNIFSTFFNSKSKPLWCKYIYMKLVTDWVCSFWVFCGEKWIFNRAIQFLKNYQKLAKNEEEPFVWHVYIQLIIPKNLILFSPIRHYIHSTIWY